MASDAISRRKELRLGKSHQSIRDRQYASGSHHPWSIFASSFRFIEDSPRVTPHVTPSSPLNKPNQEKVHQLLFQGPVQDG